MLGRGDILSRSGASTANSPKPLASTFQAVTEACLLFSAGSVAVGVLIAQDDSAVGLDRIAQLREHRDRETTTICADLDDAALPSSAAQPRLRNFLRQACRYPPVRRTGRASVRRLHRQSATIHHHATERRPFFATSVRSFNDAPCGRFSLRSPWLTNPVVTVRWRASTA